MRDCTWEQHKIFGNLLLVYPNTHYCGGSNFYSPQYQIGHSYQLSSIQGQRSCPCAHKLFLEYEKWFYTFLVTTFSNATFKGALSFYIIPKEITSFLTTEPLLELWMEGAAWNVPDIFFSELMASSSDAALEISEITVVMNQSSVKLIGPVNSRGSLRSAPKT